jgi:hypothetical protein
MLLKSFWRPIRSVQIKNGTLGHQNFKIITCFTSQVLYPDISAVMDHMALYDTKFSSVYLHIV